MPLVMFLSGSVQYERKREFDLRQKFKERKKELTMHARVVYRGEIRRVENLPKARTSGNT